ncbi:MAG: hypothetical protein ACRC2T_20475 [Thermoguttaceae bacterium]
MNFDQNNFEIITNYSNSICNVPSPLSIMNDTVDTDVISASDMIFTASRLYLDGADPKSIPLYDLRAFFESCNTIIDRLKAGHETTEHFRECSEYVENHEKLFLALLNVDIPLLPFPTDDEIKRKLNVDTVRYAN